MLKTFTALAIALSASAPALAATDGTLGDSSSGSAEITLNVSDASAAQIQVSGLKDLQLTAPKGSALQDLYSQVCVYMSTGGNYSMDVIGTPISSQQFQNAVPYELRVATFLTYHISGSVTDQNVTLRVTGLLSAPTQDCSITHDSLAVGISFLSTTRSPAEAGIGTATITITVTPE